MTNQLEEALASSIATGQANSPRRKTREVMYWRIWKDRPDFSRHNWITVGPAMSGPATAIEYTEFIMKKQAEPLKQYGTYDGYFNLETGENRAEPFENGKRFNPLIRQGGIAEMPKSQIVALGWHRNPELAALCPKSYKLDEVETFVCEVDGKPFNSEKDLKNYMRAMYPDAASSVALGTEVGKALNIASESSGTTLTREDLIEIFKQSNADNAKMIAEAMASAFSGKESE